MDTKTAQMLLAEAGYYRAALDGRIGPATRAAVERIESGADDRRVSGWPFTRRLIAAAQRVLTAQGHYRGLIDGITGPVTTGAVSAWRAAKVVPVAPSEPVPVRSVNRWPDRKNIAEMNKIFGNPGSSQATAGRCELPFPFVIAWDEQQRISRFSCNSVAAPAFTAIFAEAARHYGEAAFRRLRLDRFGGCFADRKMRGSATTTSTHAWGVAIDIDPINNQLRWSKSRAWLARPDYEAFWQIVEAHGGTSLGRAKNYDFMHFQLCNE